MAIIKCKMCGGELEIAEDLSICECEFCGTKQTIPKVKDENIQNLFNRANNLRMKAEFDKASEIYEKIIHSNEEEAEAYWGLILCKYGIEYVEDPATYKRIPTCHRASFDAVVADEDYKLAIKYADISQKAIYENEAKVIDEIQKGIIALAQKEEPYDIFICYKETDADGKRTQDSVIANDIYYQLTQEGFKVFYAAITLEDKLGQEYEPYIFSALNSSKVMLTLGTKPEYFNAVWVKNEWSRFLKIMKKDRSRMLIPCYRDIDAYDLPEEFAHLQAQDMSKIGFINDLVRGIKKVVVKEEENNNVSQPVVVQTSGYSANIVALLERGTMALEDEEWEKADGFFEEVLNQDAKNGDAFLGKLLLENKCSNIEELKEKYIRKYEVSTEGEKLFACDEKQEHISKQADLYNVLIFYEKATIKRRYYYDRSYISYYKNRVKQKEMQMAEFESDKLINRCKQCCENEAKEKLDDFLNSVMEVLDKRISDAKNEDEKAVERITKEYEKFIEEADADVVRNNKRNKDILESEYNRIKSEMDNATTGFEYQEVKRNLAKYSGYKDSLELMKKCDEQIEKIREENFRQKKAREKRNFKIIVSSTVILIISIIIISFVSKIITYNSAEKLLKQGKYEEAYEKYEKLKNYKDSYKKKNKLKICVAEVGETIEFGNGENNKFQIVTRSDNKVLLISKESVMKLPFGENINSTWQDSSIRNWLNNEYYNEVFSEKEKKCILRTNTRKNDCINGIEEIEEIEETTDNIFLLSDKEVEKYMLNDYSRKINQKFMINEEWWLRSTNYSKPLAINEYGRIIYKGSSKLADIGVRPALVIDIDIFMNS